MILITLAIVGVGIASYGIGVFVGYKVCEYTYKILMEFGSEVETDDK